MIIPNFIQLDLTNNLYYTDLNAMSRQQVLSGVCVCIAIACIAIYDLSCALIWTCCIMLSYWLFCRIGGQTTDRARIVFNLSIFVYGLYALLTHTAVVVNPYTDYFITLDSLGFYERTIDTSNSEWNQILPVVFETFLYSDYYLFIIITSAMAKIATYFGVADILLLLKLVNVLAGAFTVGMTYKCACLVKRQPLRPFVLFLLFTPLIENSVVLMRDIYVCLFYIMAFYYTVVKNCKYRTLKLALIAVLCMGIRPESGFFCLVFPSLFWIIKISRVNLTYKILIFFSMAVLFCIGIIYLMPVMTQVLSAYQLRDLEAASMDSLGARLKAMPIPLNVILPAMYSQLMPFPFWFTITSSIGGEYCWFSPIFSLFWIYVWSVIIFSMWKKRDYLRNNYKPYVYFLGVSVLYIIMCSYGEVNVRRIMGVYPIVFVCYMLFRDFVNVRHLFAFTTVGIIFLHIVYLVIK